LCAKRTVPTLAVGVYIPPVATAAPGCVGGGIGFTAGKATTQVAFDGNESTNDPMLQAFCTAIITQFQSTLKAETDYIATLTVVDQVDTHLGLLVYNTNVLVQQLLTDAPAAILPAVQTLTAGINSLNQGLQAANFNTGTIGAANLAKIQDGLANPPANPDVTQATADLTAFITGNCFGSTSGGTTPATPVSAAAHFTG
jgi:hypothetical protein